MITRVPSRILFTLLLALRCLSAIGGEVSREGKDLEEKLDSLDVEHLWEPGWSVAWKTGKLLKQQGEFRKSNTHCSAFVAAACLQFQIEILRPPEHATKGLANSQADWLESNGQESGWKPVTHAIEAQQFANEGRIVVVAFREKNEAKSGHIAIVRPSNKSDALIDTEGPQIIQAGATNYSSTSVKTGFRHHAGAFPSGVKYYVHDLK